MSRNLAGQQTNDTATAGVIARPPLLFLAALLLGLALDYLMPLPFGVFRGGPISWAVGGCLFLIGIALAAAGIRNFYRAATPVPTNEPSRVLVTTGIHAWTRNPIYVGMFLIYVSIGAAASSIWVLILALPLAFLIRYGVVAREEVYLERRFGEAHRDYRRRVRRWL